LRKQSRVANPASSGNDAGLRVRKPGLLQPRVDCYFAQTIKGRDQFRRYAGAQCRDRRLDERRLRYLE
jgi:hypothetical protein